MNIGSACIIPFIHSFNILVAYGRHLTAQYMMFPKKHQDESVATDPEVSLDGNDFTIIKASNEIRLDNIPQCIIFTLS